MRLCICAYVRMYVICAYVRMYVVAYLKIGNHVETRKWNIIF